MATSLSRTLLGRGRVAGKFNFGLGTGGEGWGIGGSGGTLPMEKKEGVEVTEEAISLFLLESKSLSEFPEMQLSGVTGVKV